MSPVLFELLLRSIWETVLMTGASGLISLVFGLPLYAAVFSLLNAVVLAVRLRAETAALRSATAPRR